MRIFFKWVGGSKPPELLLFREKKYESKISISNTLYGSEFLSNLGVKEDVFSGYGFQRYAVGVFRMIQDSQALFLHVTFFPAE